MTMMEGFDEFNQPAFTPSPAPAYMTQGALNASGFIPFEERTTYSPDPNRIADMAAEQRKWELAEAALPILPPMPPGWNEAVPWTGVPSYGGWKTWNDETKYYPGATEPSDWYDQQKQADPFFGGGLQDQSRWPYYTPPQHPLEVFPDRQTWNPQGFWNNVKDTFEDTWWRGADSTYSSPFDLYSYNKEDWRGSPMISDRMHGKIPMQPVIDPDDPITWFGEVYNKDKGYYNQYPHYDLYTNWQNRTNPNITGFGWQTYPWKIY